MPDDKREVVFLANSNARMGRAGAEEAKAALEHEGFVVREFRVTNSEEALLKHLDQHLKNKEPLIAIGGGDGTLRSAAEKIAGTETTMAVVPLGTGNAWARELGIPPGAANTAKALANATTRTIDLGTANGRGFVNVATMGLTALINKNLEKRGKGLFGRLAYFPAVLRSITQLRPFTLHVKTPNEEHHVRALMFVAAAGRTHAGPFQVTRAAANDDGMLSLYALDTIPGRGGLFRFGLMLLLRRHTDLDEVWTSECTSAEVWTRPAKHIIVDGEKAGRTPLVLGIRAASLRVLVPEGEGMKDES
ncbi:MAG: YegS/Rv2252/BmrU family lipid kinase [Fimbriimonadaceae bacterium]